MQKKARWVFETVRIILIIISLICFTEQVYGSSPYSPTKNLKYKNCIIFISSLMDFLLFGTGRLQFLGSSKKTIPISPLAGIAQSRT